MFLSCQPNAQPGSHTAQISELRKHCTHWFIKCPFLRPHNSSMKNHVVQLPQCAVMEKHTEQDRDVMYTASACFSPGLKLLFKMLSKYTTKETKKFRRVVMHDRGCALYVQHTHGSQTSLLSKLPKCPQACKAHERLTRPLLASPSGTVRAATRLIFIREQSSPIRCVMYKTRHS